MGPPVPPNQPIGDASGAGEIHETSLAPQTGESVARARRRVELGDFLRTRREAIAPNVVGIVVSGRRKTPGLRREEVAQLAGVGLSWYTWLEQARDITPSAQVLESIGRALRLDQTQTDHLFQLAGFGIPDSATSKARSTIGPDFDEIVRSLLPHGAYVLDPRFEVVAFNTNAELILGELAQRRPGERNLLRWLFADPGPWPDLPESWAAIAYANLLDFRIEFARHAGDPWFERFVAELSGLNQQFRIWWDEHNVEVIEPTHRQIPHGRFGALRILFIETHPVHQPGHRLRIIAPADEATRSLFAENQHM